MLHHGDLSETLKAMFVYLARAEMKSDDRDEYITGQQILEEDWIVQWRIHLVATGISTLADPAAAL